MDDASHEHIQFTATQINILRAIVTYARENAQLSSDSPVLKECLLTAILENLNHNTERQLICELVNAITILSTYSSMLSNTLELEEYILKVKTTAFNKGQRRGKSHVRKAQAKVGGRAKAAKYYDPLKELAFNLASKKNYPSKNKAAQDIAPQIIAESRKLGLELSEHRIVKTITEWLTAKNWKPSDR